MEEVSLSPEGASEARVLGSVLAAERLAAVQSSPAMRARQTAMAVADAQRLTVSQMPALDEVDFGQWTGSAFTDLDADPQWRIWNASRATAIVPGGETMQAVQQRAWNHICDVAAQFAGGIIALVSHCDVIRAIIARVLDLSLDNVLRFDIEPASISRIVVGEWGSRVVSLNERAA